MQVFISANRPRFPVNAAVEIVERKGRGHPDTLCDAIAERISVKYSQYCSASFGAYANHWFDKVVLSGGESFIRFGEGRLIRPYELTVYGKAVHRVGGDRIPLRDIIFDAAAHILSACLHGFDAQRHLRITDRTVDHHGAGNCVNRYRPSSSKELEPLGAWATRISNDCNVCSGFAPFTPLEATVLEVERYLTSAAFRERNRDVGSDIKVVGIRQEQNTRLVLNIPFIADLIPNESAYRKRQVEIRQELEGLTDDMIDSLSIETNPQDERAKPYLVSLGSAADTGDVGVVGRGNRTNGLITPMRPMSIEAANGKNPLDHTGKLYGELCRRIATGISTNFGIANEVHMLTFKSRPVTDPDATYVYLDSDGVGELQAPVDACVRALVDDCAALTREFIEQGVEMY